MKNLQLERTIFFCDAVVAIAITLLALNLKIENTIGSHLQFSDILNQWENLIAFSLSFINIANFWKTHHSLYYHINKMDEQLLLYNILWLFFIVLLPFSTSLVSLYFFDTPAIFLYSLNTLFIAIFQNLIWDYTVDKPEYLKQHTLNRAIISKMSIYCNLDMINASVAIIISFFNPTIAFIVLFTKLPMIIIANLFFTKKIKQSFIMFEKKVFTLFFLVFSAVVFAQKKSKTDFSYKVTYNLIYTKDSTDLDNKKSEYMVLFLGDNLSSFSSRAKLFKNKVVVKGNTASTSKESLTAFPSIILKNTKENYLAYTLQIVDDYFYYSQSLDLFDWKIHDETKEIKGYIAQKATTTYAGRDYIAWFTLDIPIQDGPFKFNGLPGLIIEISDTQNHYCYTFYAFEKLEPKIPFKINFNQYVLTNKEKLFDVQYRYRKDPFSYSGMTNNPNIKISPEVHQRYIKSFTEMLDKENNLIEKN